MPRKATGKAKQPFDAAKADSALRAKREYGDFIAERRVAVCGAKNPKAFAADPAKFVYTAEHCHARDAMGARGIKGAKGAKDAKGTKEAKEASGKTANASLASGDTNGVHSVDDKEIQAIHAIIESDYPTVVKDGLILDKVPREEKRAPHDTMLRLTGIMIMPYYRIKYPDPSVRYTNILKTTNIRTTQRYRVLSQVLMSLKAYRASPTTEKVSIGK